jgi:hypothetical protein
VISLHDINVNAVQGYLKWQSLTGVAKLLSEQNDSDEIIRDFAFANSNVLPNIWLK